MANNRPPFFIDMHCHPQLKPYSQAFTKNGYKGQSAQINASNLWYQDSITWLEQQLNKISGITAFRQANLRAAYMGNVQVISVTLGAVERGFVRLKKIPGGLVEDIAKNLISGFGQSRLDLLLSIDDYWADLQREIDFINQQANVPVKINNRWLSYRWVENFADLTSLVASNKNISENNTAQTPFQIALIPNIEGLHVLNCGLSRATDANEVLSNALKLKSLPVRPWYVTFCHHFYNELCGHSRSFTGLLINIIDQSKGLNEGFTALGKQVLEILLDDQNGKPIFIDIKHLSLEGRNYYRELLRTKYKGKIPLIVSHGVANGVEKVGDTKPTLRRVGNNFYNVTKGNDYHIDTNHINFYDEEILDVIRSQGIFGLQLDERRLVNKISLSNLEKKKLNSNEQKKQRSLLVWEQIQYIAELADRRGLAAWSYIAIGSDYDGIVDPLNSFWTLADYPKLYEHLLSHAKDFENSANYKILKSHNQIPAEKMLYNIFYKNLWDFYQRWY